MFCNNSADPEEYHSHLVLCLEIRQQVLPAAVLLFQPIQPLGLRRLPSRPYLDFHA